ncbi:4'-phosphopantetheinyl transferase family protein [Streptomyces sp. NPDC055060]
MNAGTPALVVIARTYEVLSAPAADEQVLAGWERDRLTRIRVPARRDDVLAARLLLRWCVAKATGAAADEVDLRQHCPDCGRAGHGRPFLPAHPQLGVSLSHADGLAAAAVGHGSIGVDVEPWERRVPRPQLVHRRFPSAQRASPTRTTALPREVHLPPENDSLARWVEAEARFKAGDDTGPAHTWRDTSRRACAALACAGPWRTAEPDTVAPPAHRTAHHPPNRPTSPRATTSPGHR